MISFRVQPFLQPSLAPLPRIARRENFLSPVTLHPVRFGAKSFKDRVESHHPVVVVGGGMAGITAMYYLNKHEKVPAILLETEKRFGGNCRPGQSPDGVAFPAGATILSPGSDTEFSRLWQELALPFDDKYRIKPEIYVLNGERFVAFGTEEERAEFLPQSPQAQTVAKGFRKLLADLHKIANNPKIANVIPIYKATEQALRRFDGVSMAEFLKPYGRLVRMLVEPYMQSDLDAPSRKLSAYVGMSDLEDLNNPRYVLPGGNSFVINKMVGEIKQSAAPGTDPLQMGNTVEWVKQDKQKAYIQYKDEQGKRHVISADHVLMAAPYRNVPALVEGLPERMLKVMRAIPKNTYAIVNLFLNKTPLNTYQFYMLPKSKRVADLFLLNSHPDSKKNGPCDEPAVMSVYTPHAGRMEPKALAEAIKQEILATFPEVKPDMIRDVQVNQFKQGMGVSSPGMVRKLKNMPKTFGRVTLINADGGAIPSITAAVDEALNGVKVAVKQVQNAQKQVTK